MWLVQAFAEGLLVETHGGYNAPRGPVDHHICQEIIERILPVGELTDYLTEHTFHQPTIKLNSNTTTSPAHHPQGS